MSNVRLDKGATKDRLHALLAPHGIYVGTHTQTNYWTEFVDHMPAVWVGEQRIVANDPGDGWTQKFRQHCKVEQQIRIVHRRSADGVTDSDDAVAVFQDRVTAAILGWTHPSADKHFTLVSMQDLPPHESVLGCDLIVACEMTYQGQTQ